MIEKTKPLHMALKKQTQKLLLNVTYGQEKFAKYNMKIFEWWKDYLHPQLTLYQHFLLELPTMCTLKSNLPIFWLIRIYQNRNWIIPRLFYPYLLKFSRICILCTKDWYFKFQLFLIILHIFSIINPSRAWFRVR